MIETMDLSKEFKGFWAVDSLNLKVSAGQILALLGPNGAGKTTTIRMLTTILKPSRGAARILGLDILTQGEQVRSQIGVLTEQHGLYPRMYATEYLEFFGNAYRMEHNYLRKRINDLLDYFELGEAKDKRLGQYSKGMRQKLALARALLHDPLVLLLDEPTSAMDPASARLVRRAIQNLRSAERAIILCTHNLYEAEELADQIAIIHQGKLVLQGEPHELKQKSSVKARVQVRFSSNGIAPEVQLAAGANLLEMGKDYFIYETEYPQRVNPLVLESLIRHGVQVYDLVTQQNTLEDVYLAAVQPQRGENHA
ncbi:MAG: ABC transporter ATP-binding protein [Anaerolineales bacterium]